MNVMATLLKIYGFLVSLESSVSDKDVLSEARKQLLAVHLILKNEGFLAVYSEEEGCFVLRPDE